MKKHIVKIIKHTCIALMIISIISSNYLGSSALIIFIVALVIYCIMLKCTT